MDDSRKLPDTVALDEQNDKLITIDQTRLPRKLETIAISSPEDIFDAIKKLKVRGAPAIGVSAAIGYYINCAKTSRSPSPAKPSKPNSKSKNNTSPPPAPPPSTSSGLSTKWEQKANETGDGNKQLPDRSPTPPNASK